MNCPKCGKEIAESALFCTGCGCRLENIAPELPKTDGAETVSESENYNEAAEIAENAPAAYGIEQTEINPENEMFSVPEEKPEAITPETNYQTSAELPEASAEPFNTPESCNNPPETTPIAPYLSAEPVDKKQKGSEKVPKAPAKAMSAWSFIWRDFLFIIPVVNIIILFVFAFAEGINRNSRSYARSRLVYALIATLLFIAGVILFYIYFQPIYNWLEGLLNSLGALGPQ